jgi:holo-ACP synthase/triphosphoribosyl-dephospho-CoA synthase
MKIADAETIAAECAKMTRRIMESEIKDMPFPGARGEIAEGLPSVTRTALPMFRELLEKGYDRNTAGAGAFIALVARGTDTNMIKRGGQKAAMDAAEQAAKIVSHGKTTDAGCLEELDKSFIAQNLSPGGCADLLAITYFLYAQDQC